MAVVAVGVLVTLCVVGFGFLSDDATTASSPAPSVLPGQVEAEATSVETEAGETEAGESSVVVSVQGLVLRPGLLHVPGTTRVGEAIDRAGGLRGKASLLGINLAERVVDGMQVVVDGKGSSVVYPGGGAEADTGGTNSESGGGGGSDSKVNINTADATTLQTLDGVGPATAEAIVAWREANGKFTTVEQLMEVRGIGPAKLEAMKDHVTV